MPLIFNSLPHKVSVQVCGNWFEFSPEQIKLIHRDEIAHLIVTNKGYEGLVSVPDVCVEAPHSTEAKEAKSEAKKRGIAQRIAHLERVKNNLLVSLRRDMDMASIKSDPLLEAGPGEKAAIRELALYEKLDADEKNKEVEELKALTEKKVGKSI